MAEFVNLNADESLVIIPTSKTSIQNITPTTEVITYEDTTVIPTPVPDIDVPTYTDTNNSLPNVTANLDLTTIEIPADQGVYEIDLKTGYIPDEAESDCLTQHYGDTNPDDSFKRMNLFSELTDEYQRAMARFNLGIGDTYSLVWGNISGNFVNQKDLYSFILNELASEINGVATEVNTKLAQWAYDIRIALEQKANIASPHFTGEPTTSLPPLIDASDRIASTEWVTAKLSNTSAINSFAFDKEFMFYGDTPINVTCSWDYNTPIESQTINDISIPINSRTHTFTNVDSAFLAKLTYVINGETYTKYITFQTYYPIYYGVNSNYLLDEKTKEQAFTLVCNSGEYGYLFIPLNNKARIAVDNIVGGFTLQGSILTLGIQFYVYKSVNSNLGELNINIL